MSQELALAIVNLLGLTVAHLWAALDRRHLAKKVIEAKPRPMAIYVNYDPKTGRPVFVVPDDPPSQAIVR